MCVWGGGENKKCVCGGGENKKCVCVGGGENKKCVCVCVCVGEVRTYTKPLIFRLRAIAETADVNRSSDVSGVDEGNVVVKIRGGWTNKKYCM